MSSPGGPSSSDPPDPRDPWEPENPLNWRRPDAGSRTDPPLLHPVRLRRSAFHRRGFRKRARTSSPLSTLTLRGSGRNGRSRKFARKRRPRPLRVLFLLGGLLVLGLVAMVADGYVQAYHASKSLNGLVPALSKGREYLAQGEVPPEPDPFLHAQGIVSSTSKSLDDARFTLRLTGALPFLNRPVVAVRRAVSAAQEETSAASRLRDVLRLALGDAATPGAGRFGQASNTPIFQDGVANIELIQKLIPMMEAALADLEKADADMRAIPHIPFVPRVDQLKADALRESAQALTLTRDALSGARLLPSLLGANGTRTYFVAMQNSADQRATGGAVLAYAFVTISKGRLSLEEGGPIRYIDDPNGIRGVKLPPALQWFVDSSIHPRVKSRLANVNVSPDFPVVARSWADLVERAAGRKVDGVIAFDPTTVSYMISPRRPIRVAAYPHAITSANAVDVIENDQYRLLHWQQALFPGQLIREAWELFRNPSPLVRTIKRMGLAMREKHLQLWSAQPDEQAQIERLGWDGGLRVGSGDYLYLTDNKLLPNKVDYYSHISMEYDVTILPSGDARSVCKITFSNQTPPGEPHDVSFDKDNGAYALNQALLGLYVPQRAQLKSSTPAGVLPDHVEGGAKVFLRSVGIAGGQTKLVQFAYSLPGVVESGAGGKVYRITVQHQAMVHPINLTVKVTLPAATVPRAAEGWAVDGNVLTLKTTLTQDLAREIQF